MTDEMSGETLETQAEPDRLVTYVVQCRTPKGAWQDIATVKVPPRTKRPTAVRLGLEQANLAPNGEGLTCRALDADNAETIPAEPFQPAPQWRVGNVD